MKTNWKEPKGGKYSEYSMKDLFAAEKEAAKSILRLEERFDIMAEINRRVRKEKEAKNVAV